MGTITVRLSAAQAALAAAIKADPALVAKLEAEPHKIHRTQTHGYATGRRKPSADQAARLHAATNGEVPADGWATTERREIEVHERPRSEVEPEAKTGTDEG